jgi:septin family protein
MNNKRKKMNKKRGWTLNQIMVIGSRALGRQLGFGKVTG